MSLILCAALIDQNGLTPLLDRLKSLGGWPVLDGDKWQNKKFDWIQAIYIRRGLGYSVQSFFVLSVNMDFKNNSKYILSVCFYSKTHYDNEIKTIVT